MNPMEKGQHDVLRVSNNDNSSCPTPKDATATVQTSTTNHHQSNRLVNIDAVEQVVGARSSEDVNHQNRQRIGRKKRQRKRPRSEWLLNETSIATSSISTGGRDQNDGKSSDDSNDDGVIITKLLELVIPINKNSTNKINNCDSSSLSVTNHVTRPDDTTSPYLRIIYPYPHTFTSFCKARWIGKSVYDVYCNEFGSYPATYYKIAIQQGRIRVSDQIVSCEYILQAQDVLLHTVHRHEPAVIVQSDVAPFIRIVEETNDLIAIDKPSTLPVHPCGGYYRDSLINLLHDDGTFVKNGQKFYTIHRLDRLTSGLIVVAKNPETAKVWGQAIQSRDDCQKIYLARVKGQFGSHLTTKVNPTLPRLRCCNDPTSLLGIPLYGEYTSKGNNDSRKGMTDVQIRRLTNAYGYWITDAVSGDVYDGDDIVPIEQYTKIEHSIDEWLIHVVNRKTTKMSPSSSKIEDCHMFDHRSRPFIWFNVACPVRLEQPKIGICSAGRFDDLDDSMYMQTVKSAETRFGIVHYDRSTDSTILIVQPMTGRTHQIRIHLQHLYHSIANDPNYGGQLWYGNMDGQRACTDAQNILNLYNHDAATTDGNTDAVLNKVLGTTSTNTTNGLVTADTPATDIEIHHSVQRIDATRNDTESLSDWIQRTCVWCNRLYGAIVTSEQHSDIDSNSTSSDKVARNCINRNDIVEQRAKLEFLVRSPGLWLHAFQYTVNDRSFRTGIPDWCRV